MSEIRRHIEEEFDALRTARDELRVRIHLGRAELRDQWEKLEKAWNHAEAKLEVLRDETKSSGEDIAEAGRLLIDEIREGYDRLRQHL